MLDISSMSTRDIVARYNAITGKNITKFENRAIAEKRLAAVMSNEGNSQNSETSAGIRAKISESVRASWRDTEVRARRTKRDKVVADGIVYGSVKQAFVALDLPLQKHIAFRAQLKAARELDFMGFNFKLASALDEANDGNVDHNRDDSE